MQRIGTAILTLAIATVLASAGLAAWPTKPWPPLSQAQAKQIEQAAPDKPIATPAKPRKVLVYGRVETHGDSVRWCFTTMDILGKKSGAFEAVASGDPTMLLPENLRQFDAIVMNNTHEQAFWLPSGFKELSPEQQKAAKDQEATIKKGFLEFVSNGKGIVGIHGATCVFTWPEYAELIGGLYAGHITAPVWIKAEQPAHPLCAAMNEPGFQVTDEIYAFRTPPYSRQKVRVLLSLDLGKTKDPEKRPDKDYPISWIRQYGKGRVFYCSLGHASNPYCTPAVLRHYLAGIQYAIGDLPADATPAADDKSAPAGGGPKFAPANMKILDALKSPTRMDFRKTRFLDAISFIKDYHHIEIQLDAAVVDKKGMDLDVAVTRRVEGVSLRNGLRQILEPLGLTHVVQDGVLLITSVKGSKESIRLGAIDSAK